MNNQNGQQSAYDQFSQAAQDGRMDKQIVETVLAHHVDPTPDSRRAIEALIAHLEEDARLQAGKWLPTTEELSSLTSDAIAAKLRSLISQPQSVPIANLELQGERQWIIPNWLPRGRVGMLTGEGGRGKSWLALQLAYALTTTGGHWLSPNDTNSAKMPLVTGGQTVLYATWEDEPAEFVRRIGADKAQGMHNCHVIDLAGAGPLWGVQAGISTHDRAALLPTGEDLRASAERLEAALLIIDSLAGAYGANENDRGAVREFMASWDAWGRKNDCAVMLIAHPPKNADGYSGSTDWHSASRWRWEIAHNEEHGTDTLKCEKASYSEKPHPIQIVRNEDTNWQWTEANAQTHENVSSPRKAATNAV